jgi:hypothetical protein
VVAKTCDAGNAELNARKIRANDYLITPIVAVLASPTNPAVQFQLDEFVKFFNQKL